LIFGGINNKKRINNDLWMIEPDSEANKYEIFSNKGEYLLQSISKIYIKTRKLSPSGKPPLPRYGHAVCILNKQYMVIHGGRNDYLIKETS